MNRCLTMLFLLGVLIASPSGRAADAVQVRETDGTFTLDGILHCGLMHYDGQWGATKQSGHARGTVSKTETSGQEFGGSFDVSGGASVGISCGTSFRVSWGGSTALSKSVGCEVR